jgi:hypothetical protein
MLVLGGELAPNGDIVQVTIDPPPDDYQEPPGVGELALALGSMQMDALSTHLPDGPVPIGQSWSEQEGNSHVETTLLAHDEQSFTLGSIETHPNGLVTRFEQIHRPGNMFFDVRHSATLQRPGTNLVTQTFGVLQMVRSTTPPLAGAVMPAK